jgi:hypothetical protein
MSLTHVEEATPNGLRLSCGAVLWFSQMEFYKRRRAPAASGVLGCAIRDLGEVNGL